jgi:hypothetical protein
VKQHEEIMKKILKKVFGMLTSGLWHKQDYIFLEWQGLICASSLVPFVSSNVDFA